MDSLNFNVAIATFLLGLIKSFPSSTFINNIFNFLLKSKKVLLVFIRLNPPRVDFHKRCQEVMHLTSTGKSWVPTTCVTEPMFPQGCVLHFSVILQEPTNVWPASANCESSYITKSSCICLYCFHN